MILISVYRKVYVNSLDFFGISKYIFSMSVIRSVYFDKIIPFINTPLVKVITGIRRCGKSVMLSQIRDYILQHDVNENQILFLNFDSLTDERVRTFESVTQAVKDLQKNLLQNQKIYLFFDEIQELPGWEKLINSYLIDFNCDIYITGSNAKLLSGELATYLAGRYVEIKMFPFSFAESFKALRSLKGEISKEKAFEFYLDTGGFPFLYNFDFSPVQQKQYLDDIFNSIILKDISARHKIRDISLLKSLIVFFVSNVANTFSSSSLIKYLKNEKRSLSTETVYNYLEYCQEACLLHLVKRENLEGKELFSTQEKIFIADHGLRQSLFTKNQKDINQILKNIVYLELLRRGCTVTVGKSKNAEIDFCAKNEKGTQYFQVCYLLSVEETVEREFGAFKNINDNFPKFVLSLDNFDFSRDGIIHKNLIDWLLEVS